MRWYGLYTQRKQGVPGERTGSAEPEELEDEFFMMRIRIDGGRLTSEQLRAIAWASERFGRDVADITDRQNVQLHWIRIEDVPAIFERIEASGSRRRRRAATRRACSSAARSPASRPTRCSTPPPTSARSRRASSAIPRSRTCRASTRRRSAAAAAGCTNPEINDVSFVGVDRPTLGPGYDLQVGGGLSTNPMFAQRLGAFVERERVPEVWAGVTSLFREYGYRRSRNHARMKFLVKDWGAERVREVLEKEFLRRRRCPTGRRPRRARSPRATTSACSSSGTAGCSWGSRRARGAIAGHQLRIVADLADGSASGQLARRPRSRRW